MTLKVNCAFCKQVVRVRNDGRVYKHRIPARTTWERGRRPECGGSGRQYNKGGNTVIRRGSGNDS